MTFGSTFGRVISPTFQPKSQAAAGGGWWDLNGTLTSCVAAYQAKGAASQAASYVNLANAGTYDLSAGGSPTWDSGGWKFGAGNYLNTGIIPSDITWSYIAKFSNKATPSSEGGNLFGAGSSSTNFMKIAIGYTMKGGHHGDASKSANVSTPTYCPAYGIMCLADRKIYLNANSATIADGGGVASTPVWIGAKSGGYGSAENLNANIYIECAAIYNTALTSTQIADLNTAINLL
jgi:hypothetical protein